MEADRDCGMEAQKEGTERRRYSVPELVHYGDLAALTQSFGPSGYDVVEGSGPV